MLNLFVDKGSELEFRHFNLSANLVISYITYVFAILSDHSLRQVRCEAHTFPLNTPNLNSSKATCVSNP